MLFIKIEQIAVRSACAAGTRVTWGFCCAKMEIEEL